VAEIEIIVHDYR